MELALANPVLSSSVGSFRRKPQLQTVGSCADCAGMGTGEWPTPAAGPLLKIPLPDPLPEPVLWVLAHFASLFLQAPRPPGSPRILTIGPSLGLRQPESVFGLCNPEASNPLHLQGGLEEECQGVTGFFFLIHCGAQ